MFKLENKYLSSLSQWLELQSLSSKENSHRIKFVIILQDKLKNIKEVYASIIEKYVEKDKNGQYKTEKDGDLVVFAFSDEKKKEAYLKELTEKYDEEFIIEETEDNKEMLETIKNIINNTTYKFGPRPESDKQERMRDIRIAYECEKWKKSFN